MRTTTTRISWIFFAAAISLFLVQCRKDQLATDPSQDVNFSADTLLFDTVFTTIGSVTLPLKVYNPHTSPIQVSDITLMGGAGSAYRLAVDGFNGTEFEDVEIGPEDSLWVFIEVTIDPNNASSPLIEEDSIRFVTNGNTEYINLVAWGRDACFHGGLGVLTVLDCDEVWNADKPHVLYGIVAVDEDCSLTINAGTQVYCHSGSGLYIYRGNLDINGTLGNEVVFQGDRLESEYQSLTGQWGIQLQVEFETGFGVEQATINRGGIWLFETEDCEIDYAILKNGIIGLQADTTGTLTGESLRINNSVITNMSAIGLFTQGAHVTGTNCLFSNCGQNTAAFTIGGQYDFNHCTFGNWWTASNRQAPSFYLNNYYVDIDNNVQVRPLTGAAFKNCIMYGNNADLTDYNEFVYDFAEDGPEPVYSFDDCYVDTDLSIADNFPFFLNMGQGAGQPPFVAAFEGDFDFDGPVPSAFKTFGSNLISNDIEGVFRNSPPAAGCYTDD